MSHLSIRKVDLWTIAVAEDVLAIAHKWLGIQPSQVYRLSCILTAAAWIALRYDGSRHMQYFQIFMDTAIAIGFVLRCVISPWFHDVDVRRAQRAGCQNPYKLTGFYQRMFWWAYLVIDTTLRFDMYGVALDTAALVNYILEACDDFPPSVGRIRDWLRSLGGRKLEPIIVE